MKDQYFGDRNDYFKYDLAIFLADQLPGIRRFSFIPMLTANDSSADGELVDYRQGVGRPDLYRFLQDRVRNGGRQVSQLRRFFTRSRFHFAYGPYGDSLRQEFTHEGREAYFQGIPTESLQEALILLDPDNGLEVPSSRRATLHKYVLMEEMAALYGRMDDASVLLLYQHLPRLHRKAFLYSTHTRLQAQLKCPLPVSLADGVIAFILITKTRSRQRELESALADYLRSSLTLYD